MDIKKIIKLLEENGNSQIDDLVWQLYEERQHFEREMLLLQTRCDERLDIITTLQQTIKAITNQKDVGE